MYFQCFVIYVLRGWYAFDWKAFLVYLDIFRTVPMATFLRAEVYVIAICSLHIYCMGCIQIDNHRNKEKNICLGRSEQVHRKICSDFPIKSFSSLFHMYYWDFCLLLGGRKIYIHLSFKKNEIVFCRTFIKHDSLFVRKNIM